MTAVCSRIVFWLPVLALVAHAAAAEPSYRFDCGPAQQKLAEGYKALSGKEAFSAERGYGWVKPWGLDTEGREHADLRFVDSVTARDTAEARPDDNDVTLRIELPRGVYVVTIWVGDPSPREGRKGMCAATNGRVVLGPPGIGGWGQVTERQLPAVVEQSTLDINLYVVGTGGAARLALLALTVEPVNDPRVEQALRKKWQESPLKDAAARTIQVGDREVTEVARRQEPARAEVPTDWPSRSMVTFTRSSPGAMLDYSVPRPDEVTSQLAGFACAGEETILWLAVHALRDLRDVRGSCSALLSPAGRIPAHELDLFTLTTRPRALSDRPGTIAALVSDLMEPHVPFDLAAGASQPLVVRLHVPAVTEPGVYVGTLHLSPAGETPLEVAVRLRVLPIKLMRPTGKVWHLFADNSRWAMMPKLARRDEIADMARHGINSLSIGYPPLDGAYLERDGRIVDADYGVTEQCLRLARDAGMDGPIFVASTAGLLLRLAGWSINQSGAAEQHLIDGAQGSAVQLLHGDGEVTSSIGAASGVHLEPGLSVRMEVRYRLRGQGRASVALTFMKSYKRDAVADGRVLEPLPATDQWRTISAVSTAPALAPYATVSLQFSGGPGALEIDEVRLLGPDGRVNRMVNGGFNRPLQRVSDDLQQWPDDIGQDYTDALQALAGAVQRTGFEAWIEGTDEAGNNPKSVQREINELAWARRAGLPTWCNLSPHLAEQIPQHLSSACHYVNFLGGWEQAREMLQTARAREQKLFYISSGCYVGQEFDLMPNRHGVGFFFWKSGYDGTAIWTYQRPNGDAFNDLDSAYKDYCLVFPPRQNGGRPIPTLGWEGVREGWRDYLYVHTLEQAIIVAEKDGRNSDATIGLMALQFIRGAVPWFDQADTAGYDNATADRLRWLAAWATMRTMGIKDDASPAAPLQVPHERLRLDRQPTPITDEPPPLLCASVDKPPTLDGRLDEPVWQQAARVTGFVNYLPPAMPASVPTELFLMHDRDAVYLGVRCIEPEMAKIRAAAAEHDGNVFADDSVEIFLDTTGDQFSFLQLAFNAAGTRFDMKCAGGNEGTGNVYGVNYDHKPVRDAAWTGDWQVATARVADRWEAEVRLPFAAVGRESDLWGIHVGRNRTVGGRQTSAIRAIGMFHQPTQFTRMLLTGSRTAAARLTKLDLPPVRWGLYRMAAVVETRQPLTGQLAARDVAGREAAGPAQGVADDGRLVMACALDADAASMEAIIRDAAGQPAWRWRVPLRVPQPIVAGRASPLCFADQPTCRVEFQTPVSDASRPGVSVQLRLLDSDGRALGSLSQPLDGQSWSADLSLAGCQPQVFELEVTLGDVNRNVLHRHSQALMLVPPFLDPLVR